MDFISNTIDSQTGQRKGHGITGSQPRCKMSRENRNKSRKFQKSSRLVAASLPSAHSEGEGVSSPNRPAGLCCGSSLGNQSCQFQSLQPPSLNVCAAGRLPPADPRGAVQSRTRLSDFSFFHSDRILYLLRPVQCLAHLKSSIRIQLLQPAVSSSL